MDIWRSSYKNSIKHVPASDSFTSVSLPLKLALQRHTDYKSQPISEMHTSVSHKLPRLKVSQFTNTLIWCGPPVLGFGACSNPINLPLAFLQVCILPDLLFHYSQAINSVVFFFFFACFKWAVSSSFGILSITLFIK